MEVVFHEYEVIFFLLCLLQIGSKPRVIEKTEQHPERIMFNVLLNEFQQLNDAVRLQDDDAFVHIVSGFLYEFIIPQNIHAFIQNQIRVVSHDNFAHLSQFLLLGKAFNKLLEKVIDDEFENQLLDYKRNRSALDAGYSVFGVPQDLNDPVGVAVCEICLHFIVLVFPLDAEHQFDQAVKFDEIRYVLFDDELGNLSHQQFVGGDLTIHVFDQLAITLQIILDLLFDELEDVQEVFQRFSCNNSLRYIGDIGLDVFDFVPLLL